MLMTQQVNLILLLDHIFFFIKHSTFDSFEMLSSTIGAFFILCLGCGVSVSLFSVPFLMLIFLITGIMLFIITNFFLFEPNFYLFDMLLSSIVASFILCLGCGVIMSTTPMQSLIFLVLLIALVAITTIFLFEQDFIAILLVTIYAGALIILFVFAVFMLNLKSLNAEKYKFYYAPATLLLVCLLFLTFFFVNELNPAMLLKNELSKEYHTNEISIYFSLFDIHAISYVLYSKFAIHFLIVGLILLVVLLGIINIVNDVNINNKRNKLKNGQIVTFKQLSRSYKI